jgi:FkbH-like protein
MSGTVAALSISLASAVARGDELRKAGKIEQAIEAYLAAAGATEVVPASLCVKLAQSYVRLGNHDEACRWALAVVDAGDDFMAWQAALALMRRCATGDGLARLRSARIALLGSSTTTQLAQLLQLAARRLGVALEVFESRYGQYRQEINDPHSWIYAFAPDFIVLAVHEGELALPEYSASPLQDVEAELRRWTSLWQTVAERCKARIVQYNFVLPCEAPMGHLGVRLSGSRYVMTQAVNARLGEQAADAVLIVDCERLAALFGKQRWFDPRYWHLAKQAVALDALPLLARHTAAVIAADLGLSRKCLVLDLDNTLWGGVIGEDGLAGIKLGQGVDGEAFIAFQEYLLKLKNKGVLLTVCSKNDESDAREPFEKHPDMRLKLDDIALFVANWQPKSDNIRLIAKTLNLGLDALVYVDDNPTERAAVRQLVPEADVVVLPPDPTQYARALSQYLLFETSSFTPEDADRTHQYRARARVAQLEAATGSIADFHRGLQMQATVAHFDEFHLPRIAQLIGKTNQFNLTTRRHGMPQLRVFMRDPNCVHFFLRLRDRFTDHGLVSLMIALHQGDLLDIDTWLMSCRVIGRTVEATMLEYLCQRAEQLGCTAIRGTYIPTAKNTMVKDIFGEFGFDLLSESEGTLTWIYSLPTKGPIANEFIKRTESWVNPS